MSAIKRASGQHGWRMEWLRGGRKRSGSEGARFADVWLEVADTTQSRRCTQAASTMRESVLL